VNDAEQEPPNVDTLHTCKSGCNRQKSEPGSDADPPPPDGVVGAVVVVVRDEPSERVVVVVVVVVPSLLSVVSVVVVELEPTPLALVD
jgi:hypothetical protein